MEVESNGLSERELRLGEIAAAYLKELDEGRAPDRQQLLARYPEFAAELTEFLAGREEVDRVAAPLREAVRATAAGLGANEATPRPDQSPLPPAELRSFGDYELLGVIGQGGMGVVYRARQKSLNRLVALKMIRAGESPAEIRRFRNEAELAADLDHPHIVPVYEVGEHEGRLYFSLKLIEGGSLAERADHLRADPEQAARLVAVIARAVHHAHQRGILHRDLKPANILLDGAGEPYVTDFGLARRVESDSSLTQSGVLVGTPSYMAPEQTTGQKGVVTTATDVYGLGALLYALLTGGPPFRADTVMDTLLLVRASEPVPPRRANPKVDRDLEAICLKCLEKEPRRRYASAEVLADDLEHWLNGEPIQARSLSRLARIWRWSRRHKAGMFVAGLVLVATLSVAGSGLWWAQKRAAAEREVNLALEDAARLQGQGQWPEALSAARRAEGLLAGGVRGDLQERVRRRRADLEMVARLEEVGLLESDQEGNVGPAARNVAYAQAFREYGIDAASLEPSVVAERLRTTSVGVELAAALDDWAMVCRATRPKDDATWKRLLAIARATDSDPWRRQLRDALERLDQAALRQLAASEQVAGLPPATLRLLGYALLATGDVGQAVRLLKTAQKRHPNDFWINMRLADGFQRQEPPQWEEALRFYSVAVALRPLSPPAHNSLGIALKEKGALDEAVAAYKESIRLYPNDRTAYYNLGLAFRKMGDLDAAIAAMREALRRGPESPAATTNLVAYLQ